MNLREVIMKYGCLVVLLRHDSAEIWEFRYGLKIKIMASTCVFVRVVFALKHLIRGF